MPLFRKRSVKPVQARKREMPGGLWTKCPSCAEIVFKQELDASFWVCPRCGYHFPLDREERIRLLSDGGLVEEWDGQLHSVDVLGFTGAASYKAKLEQNIEKTGHPDAITCGRAQIGGRDVALGVMDFKFLGASMGSVVGEKVTRLFERATGGRLPVVLCCASGGARMYEGLFSLMQMAKTSGAVARHAAARLPYISVLTDPTTAGVMASFATLGDVILAEPGALIGFAGPRVIKETTQQELPDGFQRAEFLLRRGLLDQVVPRKALRKTLIQILDYLAPPPPVPAPAGAPAGAPAPS